MRKEKVGEKPYPILKYSRKYVSGINDATIIKKFGRKLTG